MTTAINVEDIGKKYIIKHQSQGNFVTLRETIAESVKRLGKRFVHPRDYVNKNMTEEFWALKDVSFEVHQGDRIGIIGRNGAGKSTILKILSRITEPTSGRIGIKGRVASLLEVGTGFHPELTGRENVFLNGAILGMGRAEIKKKFDEIVDFADVEKFIDTPVKRYSSGMYVRLAFAVAAHLEPEILIVDEVLAVGDAQFQKKCLGKMKDVGKEGRTVLFVSHNMEAVSGLCNNAVVLKSGAVQFMGEVHKAISLYNGYDQSEEISVGNCSSRGGAGGIRITDVWLTDKEDKGVTQIKCNNSMTINIAAEIEQEYQQGKLIDIGFGIDTSDGKRLITNFASWTNQSVETSGDSMKICCNIPSIPLIPGRYLITIGIVYRGVTLDNVEHCAYFDVTSDGSFNFNGRTHEHGYLQLPCQFTVR